MAKDKQGINLPMKEVKPAGSKKKIPTATAPMAIARERIRSNAGYVALALARLQALGLVGMDSKVIIDNDSVRIVSGDDVSIEATGLRKIGRVSHDD